MLVPVINTCFCLSAKLTTSLNITIPVDTIYDDTEIPLPKVLYPLSDEQDDDTV